MPGLPARKGTTHSASAEVNGRQRIELITADHVALGSFRESPWKGYIVALIVQEHAMKWVECHPNPSKSANDTMMGSMNFVGTDDKVGRLYTDGTESCRLQLGIYRGDTTSALPNALSTGSSLDYLVSVGSTQPLHLVRFEVRLTRSKATRLHTRFHTVAPDPRDCPPARNRVRFPGEERQLLREPGGRKQKPKDNIVSSSSSASVGPEQEATPAESTVVKDYWIDSPDGVIRVHRVPRRELYVPIARTRTTLLLCP